MRTGLMPLAPPAPSPADDLKPPMADRDIIFISKATPGDDEFVLWLAPKLEAAGYQVFADILNLDTGERWRRALTDTLQQRAAKMLLCCSNETLDKDGVQEEIGIGLDLAKQIPDPTFILPLRLSAYRRLFGIGELQYIDFESNWGDGLEHLLASLRKQGVRRIDNAQIQPQWEQYLRRKQVEIEHSPEILTSNWLRLLSAPDKLRYVQPRGACDHGRLKLLGKSFEFPLAEFNRGFLTFGMPDDFAEHFVTVGPFEISAEVAFAELLQHGDTALGIAASDAANIVLSLLRQAWEKHCQRQGFLAHEYSKAVAYHVGDDKAGIGSRIFWGRQGQRRNSMLRNISGGKVWEYGVSVIPSLFPYPHLRLKSRVLFSDMENKQKTLVIPDKDKQHQLRRRICSGWRNKAWHGRLMAFMELLTGESPYVSMQVGRDAFIVADAMPVQFTSPVTTTRKPDTDDDGEEDDPTTLGIRIEDVEEE